ncbi:glycerophosphodiester phosphodiesterase [Paenibacillus tarimensis]|uniref:glycerophosphodiester phosphodiesterase n=1 Tax=Paenibacillus tarimensis TaxID=416012 RepID=UPI001F181DB6|nr:glycerophosphodiester phosphodiesterase [Paenibacillus tarimensis]MCF2944322.1 glycerophosphodiester phosphodiesterase [Paenibacillus tarimensis]
MKPYQVIAHTGCENTPYNSIESCLAGYDAGADVLEVDVRATKDDIAVLFHDDEPNTLLHTAEEWTAAGNEPVEQLETVLRLFLEKPVAFNLDLKTAEAYDAAAAVVDKLNAWRQVYFTGVTDHLAKSDRARHVIWNVPFMTPDMPGEAYEAKVSSYCEQAVQAGFAGLNLHYESVRPVLVEQAAKHQLAIWIYTLPADEALFRRYAGMGVDGISVYEPSTCIKLQKHWSHDAV